MSAITALTAQNTTGVTGIMEVTPEFLGEQLDNIFTDIYPDAVKIGMVSSSGLITKIADKLKEYDAKNIVVDPVMVATSGARLISEEAIDALKSCLLPMATVLTPNIPEAEVLAGMKIQSQADMIRAAEEIGTKYHCAVLCKEGRGGMRCGKNHLYSGHSAAACRVHHGRGGRCLFVSARAGAPHPADDLRHGGRHHAGGQCVEPAAARH